MERIVGTVEKVQRLQNTRNGNPRYKVWILEDEMPFFTKADAMFVYERVWENTVGFKYVFTLDRANKIISCEPV